MKKLIMMMAAVALIAGYAQAVAVSWSSGAIVNPNTGANIGTTTGQYLAQIYFFTDAGGTTPFAANGVLTDTTSSLSAFSGLTGAGFTPGTYYAQMVVSTTYAGTDATQFTLTSSIRAFTVVSTVSNYSINMTLGTGLTGGGNSFPTGGAAEDYGWDPVPEPTSIALLVLGVTAIGLRRRVRKA